MLGEIGGAKVLVAWNANEGGPTSVGGTCKFLFREVRLGSSSLREPWSGISGLVTRVTHALQYCSYRETATGTNTYIHTCCSSISATGQTVRFATVSPVTSYLIMNFEDA